MVTGDFSIIAVLLNVEITALYALSLILFKLIIQSESTKERIKVMLYREAHDFDNIDNPLFFTTSSTFSSVRPDLVFQWLIWYYREHHPKVEGFQMFANL